MNALSERLIKLAVTFAVVAFLLQWAWQMLRPLIPAALLCAAVFFLVRVFQIRRRDGWY
jgi:uncharacterized membrane protein